MSSKGESEGWVRLDPDADDLGITGGKTALGRPTPEGGERSQQSREGGCFRLF